MHILHLLGGQTMRALIWWRKPQRCGTLCILLLFTAINWLYNVTETDGEKGVQQSTQPPTNMKTHCECS